MEYIPLIFSAISIIFCILTFASNRKDKAVSDTKENNIALINFRLDEIDKKIDKIIDKFDKYDKEVDSKIDKAMSVHIKTYHGVGREL